MLRVRVVNKYQDDKGKILGYALQDEDTLAIRQVYKDALVNAIRNGQVQVRNMTLTSDGRLIGRTLPRLKTQLENKRILSAVFSTGKHLVFGVYNYGNPEQALQDFEVEGHISEGWYGDINDISTKVLEGAGVKKKTFKSIKPKYLKTYLQHTVVEVKEQAMFNITPSDTKKGFVIYINNGASPAINNYILPLVTDALLAGGVKVEHVVNDNTRPAISVSTVIGKKEVTEALKNLVKDLKSVK